MNATAPRATILVVEDEPEIRRLLHTAFGVEGYRTVESATGRRGTIDAGTHKPDLAIVDLGLPDMEGIDVIRQLRQWSSMPIIVLSARVQEQTKVEALDAGADDYVTKPFSTRELQARVRAQLRREFRSAPEAASRLEIGDLAVDLTARLVTKTGRHVHLTPTEWDLLRAFVTQADRTLTHRDLFVAVWGNVSGDAQQYLRVYVGQLRRKIEDDPVRPRLIKTEPGVGYRFETNP